MSHVKDFQRILLFKWEMMDMVLFSDDTYGAETLDRCLINGLVCEQGQDITWEMVALYLLWLLDQRGTSKETCKCQLNI